MFWKKLASRADETPSYELSFAGHELGCQKQSSKTQGFFNVFFGCSKLMWSSRVPNGPSNSKTSTFPSKTMSLNQKSSKTQAFSLLYGTRHHRPTSLHILNRIAWKLFFSNFQASDSKPKFGKIGISQNQHRATKIRRATRPRATRGNASAA